MCTSKTHAAKACKGGQSLASKMKDEGFEADLYMKH
jgi:hypothetical protein